MKKLSLAILPLVAASLVLSACSAPSAQANVSDNAQAAPAAEADRLIAEGRLVPVNSLDQSFSLPGQVAEVLVKDGDQVEVGQVLARLENSPEAGLAAARAQQELLAAEQALEALQTAADSNLAQAKLAVISAQAERDTAQANQDANATDENQALLDQAEAALTTASDALDKLESNDGIDPDLLAAAEARLAAAKAAVSSAQAALDALELKSTLAGMVVDLDLQTGQRVAAGTPVLTVADFSGWHVKTDNLTETEVVKVTVGQKVSVTLDALPSSPLSGEVTHINARYEEKRGDVTYTVTIVLNQTEPLMRWGMTAAVEFLP